MNSTVESRPVGVLFSRVRAEEKLIFRALEEKGVNFQRINDCKVSFSPSNRSWWEQFSAVLVRSLSYTSGLYATRILTSFGIPTVNTLEVVQNCGDKVNTTLRLEEAEVPQPKAVTALSPEQALIEIEEMGYPVVIKPAVGSWGRMIAKVNDRDAAEAVVEHKQLGGVSHSTYYIQEYINKPMRDIRSIVIGDKTVVAIYRESDHWITNTARGGTAVNCEVTDEIDDISRRAARAVGGGGILAIDLLEDLDEERLLVNEINHSMEFRNCIETGANIPVLMVNYLLSVARG